MKKDIWLKLICIEFFYIVFATTISVLYVNDLGRSELFRTIIRIFTLIIYSSIYLKIEKPKLKIKTNKVEKILLILSISCLMIFPFIFMKSENEIRIKILWFLTSFIVGFREEIFYRGFIQNELNKRMKLIPTILLTSVIFTSYHVVYFYWGLWLTLIQVIFWSIFIGLLYYITNNLVLVSLIHSFYDAIPFISPITRVNISYIYGLIFIIISIILLLPVIFKGKKT